MRRCPASKYVVIVLLLFAAVTVFSSTLRAEEAKGNKTVLFLSLQGTVNPGSADFFERAIDQAEKEKVHAILVELDTPGGLVSSLRAMVQSVLASPVPVIVYVAPQGAQAASAGALLTLSAHVAAMSPGTEIGAAHPVGLGGGGDGDETMSKKAENDLAAFARSIAEERGRNAEWAENAVRESIASTANEALKAGVIDFVAADRAELFRMLDGRTVETIDGSLTLDLTGAVIEEFSPTLQEQILIKLADPNLAYIFIMVGLAGLYFELANPGSIFPGVLGAISLLLALFALQALPVNVVGVLLIVLAVVFFGLELFVASGGILALAGLVALFVGSLMLFNTAETGISISMTVFLPVFIMVSVSLLAIVWLVTKSSRLKLSSGPEQLIGEEGSVIHAILPGQPGKVFVHGELWDAESGEEIPEKGVAIVKGLKGLILQVTKKQENV
ncbi:MAG: nodulation protein NfeD [Chlorobium phaeobacteroides]|nr:nodulation protein NfeD [Chlorobium phaeobacteroides]MBL6955538.1 nodulation protein NfeD [Chlorobium phaeobacteroides]